MKNFGDMLNDAKQRCSYTNADLDKYFQMWLNDGIAVIGRRFLWPFMETSGTITTVAATTDYSLASDVGWLYLLRDTTNNRKLEFITQRQLYSSYPNPTASGVSSNYYFSGSSQSVTSDTPVQQVGLYPIPDGAYTIKYPYYKRFNILANASDISLLPSDYHELPVDYAASVYFEKRGDPRAVSHMDKFENGMLDMANQLGGVPVDRMDVLRSADSPSRSGLVRLPAQFGNVGFN